MSDVNDTLLTIAERAIVPQVPTYCRFLDSPSI